MRQPASIQHLIQFIVLTSEVFLQFVYRTASSRDQLGNYMHDRVGVVPEVMCKVGRVRACKIEPRQQQYSSHTDFCRRVSVRGLVVVGVPQNKIFPRWRWLKAVA